MTVQPDWWRLLRGTRGRCLVVPAHLNLGTWRHGEGEDFLALRPEDPAIVCVDLRPPAPRRGDGVRAGVGTRPAGRDQSLDVGADQSPTSALHGDDLPWAARP